MIALSECWNVILESIGLISSGQGNSQKVVVQHSHAMILFQHLCIKMPNEVYAFNSVSKDLGGFLKPMETPSLPPVLARMFYWYENVRLVFYRNFLLTRGYYIKKFFFIGYHFETEN